MPEDNWHDTMSKIKDYTNRMIVKKRIKITQSLMLGIISTMLIMLPMAQVGAMSIGKTTSDSIDTFAREQTKRARTTGAAIGVIHDNKVTLKGYGELRPDSPVIIASLSKSFTALAVMQQVEDGKIALNDPIVKFLPDFKVGDGKQSRHITVKQLLSQTSGISTKAGQIALNFDKTTLDEAVHDISAFPLSHEPGKGFEYSNANYILAGRIVEKASALSFGQYMAKHIFEPLQMKNTSAMANTQSVKNFVKGNINVLGAKVPMNDAISPALVPDGYIISTAEDMTHYLTMQLNEGVYENVRVISKESLQQMHMAQASLGDTEAVPNSTDYGLGWGVGKAAGQPIVSHDGQLRDMQTNMAILPQSKSAIVVLVNEYGMLLNEGALYQGVLQGVTTGTFPAVDSTYLTYYLILDAVIIISVFLIVRSFMRLAKWRSRMQIKIAKRSYALAISLTRDIFIAVLLAVTVFIGLGASFGSVPMPLSLLMFGTADLTVFILLVIAFFVARPIVRYVYWSRTK